MATIERISEHLYRFTDTCNVYVVKDGQSALLIDAGSGAVLESLPEIGCRQVEWVLHTHHHRDQCWGDPKLIESGARLAVPQYERHLFEKAELFWQTRRVYDNYDDRNNFFSSARDLPVSATLDDYQEFVWRGYRFYVLPAKGHTQGSVALLAEIDGRLVAFSGDLMAEGGRLYQLHAMEYTYGDMTGALFTLQSIQALRDALSGEVVGGRSHPVSGTPLGLPSHGGPIEDPLGDIDRLEKSLVQLVSLGRGMRVGGRESIPEMLYLPEPRFVQLSDHLLWGGSWTCSFFYVVLSGSGKALFVDYGHAFHPHMHTFADHNGLEVMRFIEHHLKQLRQEYGVHTLDLAIPTHIHDDHTCGIPHLQQFYGTRCWALDAVAQVLADPAAWSSTPCTFHKPIRIDRTLRDGERFDWEEYTFDVHFAPGQTEYHSVLSAEIDGQKVAFTGDNYFLQEVLVSGKVEVKALSDHGAAQQLSARHAPPLHRGHEPGGPRPDLSRSPGSLEVRPVAAAGVCGLHSPQGTGLQETGGPTQRPLHRSVLGPDAALPGPGEGRGVPGIPAAAPQQPGDRNHLPGAADRSRGMERQRRVCRAHPAGRGKGRDPAGRHRPGGRRRGAPPDDGRDRRGRGLPGTAGGSPGDGRGLSAAAPVPPREATPPAIRPRR